MVPPELTILGNRELIKNNVTVYERPHVVPYEENW